MATEIYSGNHVLVEISSTYVTHSYTHVVCQDHEHHDKTNCRLPDELKSQVGAVQTDQISAVPPPGSVHVACHHTDPDQISKNTHIRNHHLRWFLRLSKFLKFENQFMV